MITISYNRSIILLGSLKKIEELKKIILLTPISPRIEFRLRWEATINRIYYTFFLTNNSLPKREIIKLLTSQQRKKPNAQQKKILNYKKTLDYIYQSWLVSRFPITVNTISTLNGFVCQGKLQPKKRIELQKTINFLTASPENPIIQAAILQAELIINTPFVDCNNLTAHLLTLLTLCKYGYNFRNMLVLEEYWSQDLANYKRTLQTIVEKKDLTSFLEYFTQGMVDQLEKTAKKIKKQRLEITIPADFWRLTDRQKSILTLLEEPNSSITNKHAQKIYKISQITASRDLAKLTSLGLLFSHGKGRSTYYTRGYSDI